MDRLDVQVALKYNPQDQTFGLEFSTIDLVDAEDFLYATLADENLIQAILDSLQEKAIQY